MEDKIEQNKILQMKLQRMLRATHILSEVTLFEVSQSQSAQLDFFSAYDELRFTIHMYLAKEISDQDEVSSLMSLVDSYLDNA
ncbi:MAG: hypothetical protein GY928_33115 [Colwellia sp.]|nr:hypothetical protein [Colwellia sp.]